MRAVLAALLLCFVSYSHAAVASCYGNERGQVSFQINLLVFDRSPQALDVYLCRGRLLGTAPERVVLALLLGAAV